MEQKITLLTLITTTFTNTPTGHQEFEVIRSLGERLEQFCVSCHVTVPSTELRTVKPSNFQLTSSGRKCCIPVESRFFSDSHHHVLGHRGR